MTEMKRISSEEITNIIWVGDPKEGQVMLPPIRAAIRVSDAQLQADKEAEMANRKEMIEEIEQMFPIIRDTRNAPSNYELWQNLKERWLK